MKKFSLPKISNCHFPEPFYTLLVFLSVLSEGARVHISLLALLARVYNDMRMQVDNVTGGAACDIFATRQFIYFTMVLVWWVP